MTGLFDSSYSYEGYFELPNVPPILGVGTQYFTNIGSWDTMFYQYWELGHNVPPILGVGTQCSTNIGSWNTMQRALVSLGFMNNDEPWICKINYSALCNISIKESFDNFLYAHHKLWTPPIYLILSSFLNSLLWILQTRSKQTLNSHFFIPLTFSNFLTLENKLFTRIPLLPSTNSRCSLSLLLTPLVLSNIISKNTRKGKI